MKDFDTTLLLYMGAGALLYTAIQETKGKKLREDAFKKGLQTSFPGKYTGEDPAKLVKEELSIKQASIFGDLSKNRGLLTDLMLPTALALAGYTFMHFVTESKAKEEDISEIEKLRDSVKEYISANWELKRWKMNRDVEKRAFIDQAIDSVLKVPGHVVTSLTNVLFNSKVSFDDVHGAWLAITVPIAFFYGRERAYDLIAGVQEKYRHMQSEGWTTPDKRSKFFPFRRTSGEAKYVAPVSEEKAKKEVEEKLTKEHKSGMTLEELFNQVEKVPATKQ